MYLINDFYLQSHNSQNQTDHGNKFESTEREYREKLRREENNGAAGIEMRDEFDRGRF